MGDMCRSVMGLANLRWGGLGLLNGSRPWQFAGVWQSPRPRACVPQFGASGRQKAHVAIGETQARGGQGNYGDAAADAYAKIDLREGTFWLIYRHTKEAIIKSLGRDPIEARALDWGCGAGKSTRWLRDVLRFADVSAADISERMLERARKRDDSSNYALAEVGRCPFMAGAFDLVLSMCVLIEIPSLEAMSAYAHEACRMARDGGIVVAVSATEESHDPANDFLSFRYLASNPADPHNHSLQSGDRVQCQNVGGLVMEDFYWSRNDIQSVFEGTGLRTLSVTRTLGSRTDPFAWRAELQVASDYVFVFQKPMPAATMHINGI